ncbi:MAG: class I SAM-dependent methyltransferase [Candidatus Acidiferrales bacterium]
MHLQRAEHLTASNELNQRAFVYSGDELEAMDSLPGYYAWMLRHFRPFLGQRIVEIGAGTGNFAEFLLRESPGARFLLFEPAANLFPSLERRFAGNAEVTTIAGSLDERAAAFAPDTVCMVNVLEHIEDDTTCLTKIWEALAPGGHLLLFVPALPAIYGSLDRACEHFRRYKKAELSAKIRAAGFSILEMRYFNLVGVAAWFFSGRIVKKRTVDAGSARFFDRWLVPPSAWLENHWEPPLGQSLLAVARK